MFVFNLIISSDSELDKPTVCGEAACQISKSTVHGANVVYRFLVVKNLFSSVGCGSGLIPDLGSSWRHN